VSTKDTLESSKTFGEVDCTATSFLIAGVAANHSRHNLVESRVVPVANVCKVATVEGVALDMPAMSATVSTRTSAWTNIRIFAGCNTPLRPAVGAVAVRAHVDKPTLRRATKGAYRLLVTLGALDHDFFVVLCLVLGRKCSKKDIKKMGWKSHDMRRKDGKLRLHLVRYVAGEVLQRFRRSAVLGGCPRDLLVQDAGASAFFKYKATCPHQT
jgi:hypothetical protein